MPLYTKGLSSTNTQPGQRGLSPAPSAGLRSMQLQQSRLGIQYDPATQQKLNVSPQRFQANRPSLSQEYSDRTRGTRDWGKSMHDKMLYDIQKKKDLKRATQLQNQWNQMQQQVGAQPGVGVGSAQPSTARELQNSVGIGSGPGGRTGTLSSFRSEVLQRAKSYLGTPYTLGGGHQPNATTPSRGWNGIYGLDCSGLTGIVYRQMGINLPAIANQQSVYGKRTSISNAKPGDLVGWAKGGHIAIYIGGGKIIHAPRPGEVVQIRNLFQGEQVFAVSLTLPGD